ncbi:MAG: membrane protein FxsA [Spirochaetaceae bacterium]|nr:MAG: membrane protein FxsA [Spirochaetaceae bacterium]
MFLRLLLLFTITPVVELYILIRLGSVIGVVPTILIVIGTGILGASLAKREGFAVLRTIQVRMNRGEIPADAMIDGLCILVAGLVLITPGILTDVLGFLLLVPATRRIIKSVLVRRFRDAVNRGTVHVSGAMFEQDRDQVRTVKDGEATFIHTDDGPVRDEPDR